MLCNAAVTSRVKGQAASALRAQAGTEIMSYRDALHWTMHDALQRHDAVLIMGQGVDDHKGIFGSTTGLSQEFGPDRVMDTPLAEEGMTGVAIGAALNGLYPIQTHIRADFSLLAMNQIINLAAKYKYMFGGRFDVPMLIRMIVGRSWGQGAQHSQSLQSLFAHIPGLQVLMPSSSQSILDTYPAVIDRYRGPVISFEHRLMYDLQFYVAPLSTRQQTEPFGSRLVRPGEEVTIVATSIMVLEAMRAAEHLALVSDIQCEVIDLHCVSSPDWDLVMHSVEKTGRLVVADTSWREYGVCAEVCRVVAERNPGCLKAPVVTLGMQPAPCPTAKCLEDLFYPDLRQLVDALAVLVTGKKIHGLPLPDTQSMADVYKRFKGPF
ncbi:alpha-ketoacid dehydrogenase subunit beta [Nitrospira sp. T9]|uniref:alpha-ketoacid dehydrogenase subunit beta n=1 Tax=unclassified Nitrospira TaxID=2652172 RepID=UPI003F9D49FA